MIGGGEGAEEGEVRGGVIYGKGGDWIGGLGGDYMGVYEGLGVCQCLKVPARLVCLVQYSTVQ